MQKLVIIVISSLTGKQSQPYLLQAWFGTQKLFQFEKS